MEPFTEADSAADDDVLGELVVDEVESDLGGAQEFLKVFSCFRGAVEIHSAKDLFDGFTAWKERVVDSGVVPIFVGENSVPVHDSGTDAGSESKSGDASTREIGVAGMTPCRGEAIVDGTHIEFHVLCIEEELIEVVGNEAFCFDDLR